MRGTRRGLRGTFYDVPCNSGVNTLMFYRDAIQMLRDIQAHTKATGHRVLSVDDPMMSRVGFSCAVCNPSEGQDGSIIHWYSTVDWIKRVSSGHPCRVKFSSQANRTLLAQELSAGTLSIEYEPVPRKYPSRFERDVL